MRLESRFQSKFRSRLLGRSAPVGVFRSSSLVAAVVAFPTPTLKRRRLRTALTGPAGMTLCAVISTSLFLTSSRVKSTVRMSLQSLISCTSTTLPNESDSLRCLIAPTTRTATAVNNPTHTANEGFTGNGSSAYIDLNFTPSTDVRTGHRTTLLLGVVPVTSPSAPGAILGALGASSAGFTQVIRSISVYGSVGPNGGSYLAGVDTPEPVNIAVCGNRSGASAAQLYIDGVAENSNTASSNSLLPQSLYLLARNNNGTTDLFTDAQVAASFGGGSLTADQHADLNAALKTYRTAREA